MKNIPKKIYLQIGCSCIGNCNCTPNDFNVLMDEADVSWCKYRVYDNDIEYVLKKEDTE